MGLKLSLRGLVCKNSREINLLHSGIYQSKEEKGAS